MRNVPPGPANYAQRSGRAGRKERIALINAFSLDRAHDTYFFDRPAEMIAGAIDPPDFTIENRRILSRQINSLILEKLDFQFQSKLGLHLSEDESSEFTLGDLENEVRSKRNSIVHAVLSAFNKDKSEVQKQAALAWINQDEVGEMVDGFYQRLRNAFDPWLVERDALFEQILQINMEMARVGRRHPKQAAQLSEQLNHFYRLLDQIDARYPLSYLSDQGFLPSYAFPSDSARLIAKGEVKRPIMRNMDVALFEYAPGNKVYMDQRKYQVIGLDFHRSPMPNLDQEYKKCETCSYVSFDMGATHCPHCQRMLSPEVSSILFAQSFVAERSEAIGADEEYRDRAFYDNATYLLETEGEGRSSSLTGVKTIYHRQGEILVVNQGLAREEGNGFMLCRKCGYWHSPTNKSNFADHRLLHNRKEVCGGNGQYYHLGHQFRTDVLLLQFEGVPQESEEFYASLKAAIIEAANSVVQAESGEISGFTRTVHHNGQSHQDLILYDNVPGGAGYVRKAAASFGEIIQVARALLDGCQCEKSCYKCLRSYRNQFEHSLLDKRLIQPYLDQLIVLNSAEEQQRIATYGPGTQRFCGVNASIWLQRQLRAAGGDLFAICEVVDSSELAQGLPWVEALTRLAEQSGRTLHLGLTHLPTLEILNEESFLSVKALVDLLNAGVKLTHVTDDRNGRWQMVLGVDNTPTMALAALDEPLRLTRALNEQRLVYNSESSTWENALQEVRALLRSGTPVTLDLLHTAQTEGYELREIQDGESDVSFQELFGDYLSNRPWIRIVDPYVRQLYQVRNVEDLLFAIGTRQGTQVELVTMYEQNPNYGYSGENESRQRLDDLKERLSRKGIHFSYRFDGTIHDRHIETDKWQIILGRGLDLYYPPENGQRKARACRVIYLPK